jgi:hypothetical protein
LKYDRKLKDLYLEFETNSVLKVFVLASKKPISGLKETFDIVQDSSKEEILEVFKDKAPVVQVLSFKHQ